LKSHTLDTPQTANGTAADNDSETRKSQLKQLYINSFTNLQSAAFEHFPELTAYDCHAAMQRVAGLLPTYGGPVDSVSFEKWGERIAVQESSRYVFMHLANGEYRLMLLKVIADNLWTSATDRSIEPHDLFNDVLMLIFDMAPVFLRNKRAKLSTRMCSLAKRHVFFHNSKNKKRLAAVTRQIERGGEFRSR
jgi:hypothetical protein